MYDLNTLFTKNIVLSTASSYPQLIEIVESETHLRPQQRLLGQSPSPSLSGLRPCLLVRLCPSLARTLSAPQWQTLRSSPVNTHNVNLYFTTTTVCILLYINYEI